MATISTPREYELILLGATGYTGKLCAEYITTNLPTNIKWAVAGRSDSKLSALTEELKAFYSDRLQPGIELAALVPEDLDALTRKTRLLINTVGPYHRYSSPVVEACARNGTHYLDVTGESPWVLEMITKYHDTAKANGAIIIPQIGIESAPADLLAYALTSLIRKKLSVGTKEIISCVHDMKGLPSGGTLATILSILDYYSLRDVANAGSPWVFSPVPGPRPEKPVSLGSRLFGVRSVPHLGVLTTFVAGSTDRALVQRSWGLLDGGNLYGRKFQYSEYVRVRNAAYGIAVHFAIAFCMLALVLPPVRWLVKKLVFAPGEGASKESTRKDAIEFRAIATADEDVPTPGRAIAKLRWDGGLYYLTGIFLAEAAMVILRDDDIVTRIGGGLLTPAMLGEPFIERLRHAGLILETEMMSDE